MEKLVQTIWAIWDYDLLGSASLMEAAPRTLGDEGKC